MAVVYSAQDIKHSRKVAIKVLRPEFTASIGVDRFLREVEIAAKLTHPHVLSLHDSGKANGNLSRGAARPKSSLRSGFDHRLSHGRGRRQRIHHVEVTQKHELPSRRDVGVVVLVEAVGTDHDCQRRNE